MVLGFIRSPHRLSGKLDCPLATWVHGTLDSASPLERLAGKTQPDLLIANSRHTLEPLARFFVTCRLTLSTSRLSLHIGTMNQESPCAEGCEKNSAYTMRPRLSCKSVAWNPGKGHIHIVQALSQILADRPWQACVGRWGAALGRNRIRIVDLGMRDRLKLGSRLQMLGQRSDVSDLMAAADVFLFDEYRTGEFGMVFVEALQAGYRS